MEIRTLQQTDLAALLTFEAANRAWFERTIQPRPPSVYSVEGMREHVEQCLDAYRQGSLHPCVMLDAGGAIVGRANLKDIDHLNSESEVGYRIAEQWVGQGLASRAVAHMKELAAAHGLCRLIGIVSLLNPASARVLLKAGFVPGALLPSDAPIGGQMVDCRRYLFVLGAQSAGTGGPSRA